MGSPSENNSFCFSPLDPKSFTEESKAVIDFIANYDRGIEEYPVPSQVHPGYLFSKLPSSAPYRPQSLEDILKDVGDSILPGLTHWQSPNFFGYFQANASTAGFVGEMLCSGFNVVGFNWISSPAATELESIVLDWMGKLLKLPCCFLFSGSGGNGCGGYGGGGVLHGSTCEAIVCVLAAARDRALSGGSSWEKLSRFVVYTSDQAHFTVQKAAKLVGIPPSNFRSVATSFSDGFSLSPQKLQSAIEDDIASGLIPLFLCATVGTTAVGAVDPIEELAKIARKYKLWFHIDAAYAGAACICPEFSHYLDGVELADSLSMNPHKWFLTNMECCCLWVKSPKLLLDSLGTESEIMRNGATESCSVIDYKDWQIALSRRFRALKLWIVIQRHGVANLMCHIRSDVSMAKRFEAMVVQDKRFKVVVPRKFALVCFRLRPRHYNGYENEANEVNARLLAAVNESGRAFMTHAVVGGVYVIRCAIGSTFTQEHHVDSLWKLIQEKAEILLTNAEFKNSVN